MPGTNAIIADEECLIDVVWIPETALDSEPAWFLNRLSAENVAILGPSSSDVLRRIARAKLRKSGPPFPPFAGPVIDFAATAPILATIGLPSLDWSGGPPPDQRMQRAGADDFTLVKSLAAKSGPPFPPFAGPVIDFAATAPVLATIGLPSLDWSGGPPLDHWMQRAGADDFTLVKSLAAELERRFDKKSNHRVILLAESNTTYGNRLRACFAAAFGDIGGDQKCPFRLDPVSDPRLTLLSYDYARGLDEEAKGGKRDTDDLRTNGGGDSEKSLGGGHRAGDFEQDSRAEGDRQTDYVLRLAKVIDQQSGSTPISAIGIFGTDVYDKRLILKALRPMFPATVFFTTDLDATLLEPSILEYTRGLLIATDFTLTVPSLRDHDHPTRALPFRDTYQTGAYVAARYALQCIDWRQTGFDNSSDVCPRLVSAAATPHLLEVGRFGGTLPLVEPRSRKGLLEGRWMRRIVDSFAAAFGCVLAGLAAWFVDRGPGPQRPDPSIVEKSNACCTSIWYGGCVYWCGL